MKEQSKHPIDQYFKEKATHDFAYDPELWQKVEKRMIWQKIRKTIAFTSVVLISIFSISLAIYYLSEKSVKDQNPMAKMDPTQSEEGNNNNEAGVFKQENYPDLNASDGSMKDLNSVRKYKDKISAVQIKKEDTKRIAKNKKVHESHKRTFSNKTENLLKGAPEKQIEFQKPENSKKIEPIEETETIYEVFSFTPLDMESHLQFVFPKSQQNEKPEPVEEKFRKDRKRFAVFYEYEQLHSYQVSQNITGPDKDQNKFRMDMESNKKQSSMGINLILQKRGIAFVTGLGFSRIGLVTDYKYFSTTYTSISKYRMIRDSIPYSGGYYSHILEYQDTLSSTTEEKRVNNQTPSVRFNYIRLPLKLSYQFPIKRLRIGVRAGLDLSYLQSVNGSLNTSGLDNSIEQNLKRINGTASFQLLTGVQLRHNLQAGLSAYYGKQLGSNMQDYGRKFNSYDFGFYLRYNR
ncbi:MAG: hypothetical protein H6605_09865 [Flavobacteriales bacterium]|nr:hypothetical protein [Flavobacteriales bacterium]